MPDNSHLFISYARADGLELAQRLVQNLEKAGYHVWRDQRDLNRSASFDALLERAIEEAQAVIAIITPDVKRETSFVRNEILHALEVETPIIPVMCANSHLPITIKGYTWANFKGDYENGLKELFDYLKRVADPTVSPMFASTRTELEINYLRQIGRRYEVWLHRYTDLAGQAEKVREKQQPKVPVKAWVTQYTNTLNRVYDERGYVEEGATREKETVNELREVVRAGGVVLIGEPGSGKTTTLQRLTYEFAVEAAEALEAGKDDPTRLPLLLPLGAYTGGGLENFFAERFQQDVGAALRDYLPERLILLLDGLNEMPRQYVSEVDAWIRANPQVRVVVTCRRLDYAALKALPLRRVDVAPLDVTRIHLFIGNFVEDAARDQLFWALVGEKIAELWSYFRAADLTFADFWGGEAITDAHPAYKHTRTTANDAAYNAMRAAMPAQLPGLLGLVSNPFLLNMTVDLFMQTGSPPTNRGQLFRDFVDNLILRRGLLAVSPEHPAIDLEKQKHALAGLAYRMQDEKRGTSVSLEWAKAALHADGVVSTDEVDNLLYLVESATLIMASGGEIKFFHQLLQEYLAALRLGELISPTGDAHRDREPSSVGAQHTAPSGERLRASAFWSPDAWWLPTGWEETVLLLAQMQTGVTEWLMSAHPILACCTFTEGLVGTRHVVSASLSPSSAALAESVQKALLTAMTGDAPPVARAEAGRLLNRLGDPRPGVGVISFPSPRSGAGGGVSAAPLPDIVWCNIPAGKFLFGDDKREIEIPYTYQIAKYPVTYAQYEPFVSGDGYTNRDYWTEAGWDWKGDKTQPERYWNDPEWHIANHPVIGVTWYEALVYCNWLTAQVNPEVWRSVVGTRHAVSLHTIKGLIRLPTEAEWEKAARGRMGEFTLTRANSI